QVSMNGPGVYYQDFNSLASAGAGVAWTDNLPTALMQGWYSNQTSYTADNGSMVSPGLYSYGTTNLDRALGSVSLFGFNMVYGARLQNTSATTFGSLWVNYTGEQWRDGNLNNFSDQLLVEYSTNATSLFSGTWTSVPALTFNSPSNVGAFQIDGNLPANQQVLQTTITGLNWTIGSEVWVRWSHLGNPSRHAMAIDDVHFQATPVPEPFGVTAMALGLGAAIRRRKNL
ncbi:MAG TPA: hypothetical protein VEX38_10675, partial [Fimbriimonadaceae bacterium]|nr:hypothetical protein [Fimbriimonadaceae bacterium]